MSIPTKLGQGASLFFGVLSLFVMGMNCQKLYGQGALIDFRDPAVRSAANQLPHSRRSYRIKTLDVQVNIVDRVARVQLAQEFQNTTNRTIEASFVFPLPYDGAIEKLTLLVGNEEYEAKLLDRDEARRIYEGYIRRNQDPALLEWVGKGMFKTSVFPIPAGQTRKVTIRYSQLCRQFQGMTEWSFPLRMARYSESPIDKLSLDVTICSQADIKTVYSSSHPVEVQRSSGRDAAVSYQQANVIPSTDFHLLYDVGSQMIGTSVLSYRPDPSEDGYFMMFVSPKIKAEQRQAIPKNVVFVLDRSGSMSGKKMSQARQALKFVINHLNPGDLFNIVAYDSEVESYAPELQRYTDESREQVLGFVAGIFAGGSTNIDRALETALAMLVDDQTPNYIVFLTDGIPTAGVTNVVRIVDNASMRNAVRARLCCFGVGYDVNSLLLDKLAREGFGQTVYVRPDEDIESKVADFYRRIELPVLMDVAMKVEIDSVPVSVGQVTNRVYPRTVTDLFAGEQLVLIGRYQCAGNAKVVLTGFVNGNKHNFTFPAEFVEKSHNQRHVFVEKLWAVRRVGEIIDMIDLQGRNQELIDELVLLSRQHGILTPYTSFLADDIQETDDLAATRNRVFESLDQLNTQSGRVGFAQRRHKAALKSAGAQAARSMAEVRGFAGQTLKKDGTVKFHDAVTDQEVNVSNLKQVGAKSFYRQGELWVDSTATKKQIAAAKPLIRFSPPYFDLVVLHGQTVGQYLALPGQVIVVIGDQPYRVKEAN